MLSTPTRRNIMDAERPPKRIITESRKEQNRIAAKAYRKRELPVSQKLMKQGSNSSCRSKTEGKSVEPASKISRNSRTQTTPTSFNEGIYLSRS
jgi:hypothetical protein